MQWLTIGGPHYNSDFTDVYDYGILLLCVFREGIFLGGGVWTWTWVQFILFYLEGTIELFM